MKKGNFRDAWHGFRDLALDPAGEPAQFGSDLRNAIQCLNNLGRTNEIDEFREKVVTVHAKNWRLLWTAAETFLRGPQYGFIVSGKFERGHHRGGGESVNSVERDRVRALQLMVQALPIAREDANKPEVADFHFALARMLLANRGHHDAWRLQYLSDLSQLPDYEQGWRQGRNFNGAPVDAEGKPVFHSLPKAFQDAKTDGERWRWALEQTVENNPARKSEVRLHFANFWRDLYGVQTMGHYGRAFAAPEDDEHEKDESGTYALHTLGEDETIARLANGIKRFKLADEFNFIKIYREVADAGKSEHGKQALQNLGQIFENRRQYPKAADIWQRAIADYGPGTNNHRQLRLEQIIGNWGRFEGMGPQSAGRGATVDFRFRNAKKVAFEAHEVHVEKLLADVKAYLKARPRQLDWQKLNIQDLGYRLVHENQKQYLGNRVAQWSLDLAPRENHWDKRITVTTPLQKAGAYLLSATVTDEKGAGPTTSLIIVWLADTAIAKKPLAGKTMYYVADAISGTPIPRANVELFGYRQRHIRNNEWQVDTLNFAETTNADGQVFLTPKQQPQDHQWIVTARTANGRLAYLGFDNVWYGNYEEQEHNQVKIFPITDRPVYRPKQTVKFKAWVRRARYDMPEKSEFANTKCRVEIRNPKNEKILEKDYVTDAFGGFADELVLAEDATLGAYSIVYRVPRLLGGDYHGAGHFRVEEYKKPEFEVTIEAPKEPVKLGDKFAATIKAKYYFGSPVTDAKVKYKVTRTAHTSQWFPPMPWDWLYGPGYWWFASDYAWYPGWSEWGCRRPLPNWWWRGHDPPEVIAEQEVKIGADGTVKVEIDTAPTKAVHGNQDHSYQITAEVVDQSRRTIVGQGNVLVARKPFKVFTWLDRGYYRVGDVVEANFMAQTLDQKPVQGKGTLELFSISYDKEKGNKPVETSVGKWPIETNDQGRATHKIKAASPGQFRLSLSLVDAKGNRIEGGFLFTVIGQDFDSANYQFNDLELIAERREYRPGETVKLMINTNRADGTVLLFVRPAGGIYQPPKMIRMKGKSAIEEIAVVQKDMPNFFVEAVTIAGSKVFTEAREIVVPPEKRVVDVKVEPSATEYKPGEKAKVQLKLTDINGRPFVGSTVVTMYDKALEYIAGGSNVPEIKSFFWKWRRQHHPQTQHSLAQQFTHSLVHRGKPGMGNLGVFGGSVADELGKDGDGNRLGRSGRPESVTASLQTRGGGGFGGPMAPAAAKSDDARANAPGDATPFDAEDKSVEGGAAAGGEGLVQPTVRTKFADAAYWAADVKTDSDGMAYVSLDMPENLTAWKFKVWAMGHGTRCGQADAEVVTRKNVIVRLQAPRFFVQKDEVVLSANVHNYLKETKNVRVQLTLEGGTLAPMGSQLVQTVSIDAGGERRVDWRVRATSEGEAVVRMSASTNEESDAMEMKFPVFVHGMLKMDSYSGAMRPEETASAFTIRVPEERRPEQSRLEVRYSPTLAGAMVDALPFMVEYPYGCTEQTLNRFLPTVITQRILLDMKIDLAAVKEKRTNLNAQEIGEDKERAKQWKRFDRNPVFDEEELRRMVKAGVQTLTEQQLSDGGWGWFSGWGEHSTPHTTAVVVHGLQVAKANDVALVPGMLERGVKWLEGYQDEQVRRIKNAPSKTNPWKPNADNIDALVFMVLTDAGVKNAEMLGFLDRDRVKLAVYAKALFGLALHTLGEKEKLALVMENIDQFVVHDDENQTSYLKLPADNYWWHWYGSENEAMAFYLKLLAKLEPRGKTAPRLVKYMLNNRKHATYWNSTRDTALCIEALADYLRASGENEPDLTVEVWVDGEKVKTERITPKNLFTFDNKFVLEGPAVKAGNHKIELKKSGKGPLYFNGYLTNFTLEDPITRAGLEVKVLRKFYKLVPVDKKIKVSGSKGQALDQKVEKYERVELADMAVLKSGDLVEVELSIESKNDYEYLIFEDMKAAGFEPFEVRSGYGGVKGLSAYMELRDNRVALFLRKLPRGNHSIAYKLRAEIPGKFSALPTRGYAMYAPELKGNSDEAKLRIED